MQRFLELVKDSIYISHTHEPDSDDVDLTITGTIRRTADIAFTEVRLLLAFRDHRNRVIHQEEAWLDNDFDDDLLEFSTTEYIRPDLFDRTTALDLSAVGEVRQRTPKLRIEVSDMDALEPRHGG